MCQCHCLQVCWVIITLNIVQSIICSILMWQKLPFWKENKATLNKKVKKNRRSFGLSHRQITLKLSGTCPPSSVSKAKVAFMLASQVDVRVSALPQMILSNWIKNFKQPIKSEKSFRREHAWHRNFQRRFTFSIITTIIILPLANYDYNHVLYMVTYSSPLPLRERRRSINGRALDLALEDMQNFQPCAMGWPKPRDRQANQSTFPELHVKPIIMLLETHDIWERYYM